MRALGFGSRICASCWEATRSPDAFLRLFSPQVRRGPHHTERAGGVSARIVSPREHALGQCWAILGGARVGIVSGLRLNRKREATLAYISWIRETSHTSRRFSGFSVKVGDRWVFRLDRGHGTPTRPHASCDPT